MRGVRVKHKRRCAGGDLSAEQLRGQPGGVSAHGAVSLVGSTGRSSGERIRISALTLTLTARRAEQLLRQLRRACTATLRARCSRWSARSTSELQPGRARSRSAAEQGAFLELAVKRGPAVGSGMAGQGAHRSKNVVVSCLIGGWRWVFSGRAGCNVESS